MKRITKRSILWAMGILGVMGSLTSCSKAGSSYTSTATTYLTVMNLAPSVPHATIYLNDVLATADTGIITGGFSKNYAGLTPGTYDIKFKTPVSDSLLYDVPSASYDTSNFYTVVLYNYYGSNTAYAARIHDDFSTASTSFASWRFWNMCPGYQNGVDFYLNSSNVSTQRTPADNVSNAIYNQFTTVSAGGYTLTVKKAGTDSVLVSESGITLSAGAIYTIFFSGVAGSSTNPLTVTALQAAYQQ